MEQRRGLLTCPEGVVVAATAEDEGVDAVEGVEDDMLIGYGRDDDGDATCLDDRLVITTA